MIQKRLAPLEIQRERPDYPQVDYIDKNGVQWIELNRGCLRRCPFCWADPNYKTFSIPEIRSNKVQIIGENILYDPNIFTKLYELAHIRYNKRVVYYGLCNGFDYRLVNSYVARRASKARIGNINNKGNWYKGINLAWDGPLSEGPKVKKALDLFLKYSYQASRSKIFVLVNWKIPYDVCMKKLEIIKSWGTMIDDCTWECTKTRYIPLYWDYPEYRKFRKACRDHNIGK
jgi:hypothetical protein